MVLPLSAISLCQAESVVAVPVAAQVVSIVAGAPLKQWEGWSWSFWIWMNLARLPLLNRTFANYCNYGDCIESRNLGYSVLDFWPSWNIQKWWFSSVCRSILGQQDGCAPIGDCHVGCPGAVMWGTLVYSQSYVRRRSTVKPWQHFYNLTGL